MNMNIAIIGLGSLFPGAKNTAEFWQNIVNKKVSIQPLPEEIFESQVFYRPELLNAYQKEDKSITRIGGWIEDLHFDTVRKYKIPPSVAEHMDTNQHAALYTTSQALEMNPLREVASDRVAVIFGNGMVGTRYGDAMFRVQFQLMEHYLRQHPTFQGLSAAQQNEMIEYVRANVLKDTIPISEDSAPGVLPNLIAGRVANVYDFHGPSFTVDAACASVLAAVITGIQGLLVNQYDAVICGGSDMPLKQLGFVLFSALNALSPNGSFPFDQRANGFVMAQGAGAVILKRLEDAIQNQDNILAVISGYGEASDGKGKYIAAPNAEWQAHAIEKACRMAGYPVDTIEMIEAHGTATKVGDVVEVQGLKQAFNKLGAQRKNYCGLTSVKSNIGHLKSAAGIAGLIKAVLAIHHHTLPPTAGFETVNPKLELENSPFYVLDETREWDANPAYPRRANVSSFGFGGADYHLALEEFRPQDYRTPQFTGFQARTTQEPVTPASAATTVATASAEIPELVTFAAPDFQALENQAQKFLDDARAQTSLSFSERCRLHNYTIRPLDGARLALLAANPAELAEKLTFFQANHDRMDAELFKTRGIYFKRGAAVTPAETAILFPGQASQYPNMFRSLSQAYDILRTCYSRADAYWFARYGRTVSSLMFPDGLSEEAALDQLRQTHNAHPAIFTASYALYELLHQTGLQADSMIGHSLGEITALAAARMLSFDDALRLVEQRGMAFFHEALPDAGQMLSIAGDRQKAEVLVVESGCAVSIANLNSPRQTILAGATAEIQRFKAFLDQQRVTNKLLYVSHAFHTDLLQPVAERFFSQIQDITFQPSPVRVMMNHRSEFYPQDPQGLGSMAQLLREQLLQPVDFAAGVQRLYSEGVRLFVEVGPGSVLSSLVKDILEGQPASILTSNYKNASDLLSLQKLYAALFAEGVAIQPLVTPRPAAAVPLSNRPEQPVSQASEKSLPVAAPSQPAGSSPELVRVVYSGAAVGLPGSYKDTFRDDNFEQLFEGRNMIERLTDDERQSLVDLQITKLVKDESGPTFKLLSTLDEVIQLAGKIGRLNMLRDYQIDEKMLQNMSSSIALGVAAGYEALRDAAIPLVREYTQTTTGRWLPQKLALPPTMQDETGVIFANGFPLIDPVIQETSRAISYRYGSKTRKELMAFYESIISRVKDDLARKLLSDWYTLYYSRLSDLPGEEEIYHFNHHFMTQISAQANNLLAYLLNARGPNFQLNAACSSTSNAITIAEDFIRSGRVKRMLVVGGDDPSSKTNLPILGAGFLCTGAASNEGDLYQAAIPFDRRRNGMIMGAGAVGIILETLAEVEKRGVLPVSELLGTHSFNTAKHISQIDADSFATELEKFIGRMEREHGLERSKLARQAVYIAHETYTPPRGGCSQTEAHALRSVFGEDFRQLIVGNTKGMTGHTMGASLEDAVVAKALQYGKCPPVVNYAQPDPMLEGLQLWKGGSHERSYALKMSAGFGAQGHFVLLRKTSSGDQRIADPARYQAWLAQVTQDPQAVTELSGRTLVVREDATKVRREPALTPQPDLPTPDKTAATVKLSPAPQASPTVSSPSTSTRARPSGNITEEAIQQIAQSSGYPPEMLETDMEFAADLGIQEERLAMVQHSLAQHFNLPEAAVQLKGDETIGQVVARVTRALENAASSTPVASPVAAQPAPTAPGQDDVRQALIADTLRLFAEVTKYPEDMLELDMEMEADLGIDTVKQATILSLLAEKYQFSRDETLKLSNYPTIRSLIELVYERGAAIQRPTAAAPGAPGITEPIEPAPPAGEIVTSPVAAQPAPTAPGQDAVRQALIADTLRLFAEVTKYPEDMLELDMEMEADLGIDTVKQATILSLLAEKYQFSRDETLKLSNYPTIRTLIELVYERGAAIQRPTAAAPGAPGATEPIEPTPPTGEIVTSQQPTPVWMTTLSRQVPYLSPEPLGTATFDLRGKNVWLLADASVDVDTARQLFERHEAVVHSLVFPLHAQASQVAELVAGFVDGKSVDVIIDLSHIGETIQYQQLSPTENQDLLFRSSTARFILYKHLSEKKMIPNQIICLTASGGAFGLSKDGAALVDPSFGALAGFYKGLRKEWSACTLRILDLPAPASTELLQTGLELAAAELEHASLGVEIAYLDGLRHIVKIRDTSLPTGSPSTYTQDDTFLISGGGSGIAARLMLAMAQVLPVSYIVIDLVQLPENIAELAALDEAGLQALRQELQVKLQQQHARVTPAILNREYNRITQAIELYRNLQEVRSLGRKVVYIECDVRDLEALRNQLQQARQQVGKITALVHAAGVDHSHLLEQKNVEEFEQVFSVKAQSAYNLMLLCQEDPLRLVTAFSSIAGRFGNAAQLDYCAANNFLSDWIKMQAQARPTVHALSLAWSGWKDVGIAWRNDLVRQHAEVSGLNLIEVEQGTAAFLNEIHQRSPGGEVLLHHGLDGFIEPGLADAYLPDFPLIDRLSQTESGDLRAWRIFSVRRDGLIDQHRLGKVPILPAVAYVELAAEYAALHTGQRQGFTLRHVTFTNPFKLFYEQPRELYVDGQPGSETGTWQVQIQSSFKPQRASTAQIVLHSQSLVSHTLPDLSDMQPAAWSYHRDQATSLPAEQSLQLIQSEGPEQRIILGPLFNDVLRQANDKEPVQIYPRGTRYPTYFPLEQLNHPKYPLQKLLVNPCLLDSLFQACAANLLVNRKRVYLPWEVDELAIVRVPRQEGNYTCHTQIVEESAEIVTFKVVMLDSHGEICYAARGVQFRLINL